MIDDLREIPGTTAINADICLIGAGAAGITIARELAGSPLRVCLVEGGGLEYEADSQALYDGTNAGSPVDLAVGRLRFLGGSTNHWGGRCAPLDEIDFRRRDWIAHSGWPISRADLEPYYARAVAVAGFPAPWLPDAQTLADTLKIRLPVLNPEWLHAFLWHYAPVVQDAGTWNWGVAYRRTLREARNVRTLLHANFAGFAADDDRNRVRSLTVKSLNGNVATVLARNYVLCCGGIENARLLLLAAEHNSGGFASRYDRVGRYFMQHSRGSSGQIVSAELMTHIQEQFNILRGPDGISVEVGLTLSPREQERQGLLNCSAVLQYQGDPDSGVTAAQDIWRSLKNGQWAPDMGNKVAHVAADLGAFTRSLGRRLTSGRSLALEGGAGLPSRSASIVLDLEQAPDPDSRILLGADRDALGLRRVKADWRIGELERRTAAAFTRLIGAEFARLDIGRCRVEPWLQDDRLPIADALKETYHYIGTTRMADDPRDGVTDRNCAVHGMRNLYVAGSSVFATAGQANPTLTIVALAVRLADHLRQGPGRP
jgi:choline dehydrogenase-like flavoprotein